MDLQALWLTLRLAGATTLILLGIAIPLGWWIAQGNDWRRAVVQAIVSLPLLLPPTVLGFYLLILMGPLTAPGRWLIHLIGHPLAFSFAGLLIGSILYSLPFAVQPVVGGFRSVDRDYIEAAEGLGASPAKVLRTVVLPTIRGSLITGAVLAFTHTVGEFGVVLMLGGNIPGATRTLSIVLYDLVEDGRFTLANRTAAFLVGVSLLCLLFLYLQPPERWSFRRDGRF